MIVLDEKKSKRFINRLTQLVNSISKYNVETVWLLQLAYDYEDSEIYPIIFCKENKINMFDYLQIIAKDQTFKSEINILKNSKNKIAKDNSLFSPMVIASTKAKAFKLTNFSNTYFIVGETYKEFIKSNQTNIARIDKDLNLYDALGNKLITNHFLYKNEISQGVYSDYITNTISPVNLMGDPKALRLYLNDSVREHIFHKMFYTLVELINLKNSNYVINGEELEKIHDQLEKKKSTKLYKYYNYGNLDAYRPELYTDFYRINPTAITMVYYPKIHQELDIVIKNVFLNLSNASVCINVLYRSFEGV